MTIIILTQEQRLDQVVFEFYGHLDYFDAVLEINSDIAVDAFLAAGTEIKLPVFQESQNEAIEVKASTLW